MPSGFCTDDGDTCRRSRKVAHVVRFGLSFVRLRITTRSRRPHPSGAVDWQDPGRSHAGSSFYPPGRRTTWRVIPDRIPTCDYRGARPDRSASRPVAGKQRRCSRVHRANRAGTAGGRLNPRPRGPGAVWQFTSATPRCQTPRRPDAPRSRCRPRGRATALAGRQTASERILEPRTRTRAALRAKRTCAEKQSPALARANVP